MFTAPAPEALVIPPFRKMLPPLLELEPAVIDTRPPCPSFWFPVASVIVPDDPELVVPVKNTILPLIPVSPASRVRRTIEPLDLGVDSPLSRETNPPVFVSDELGPALKSIFPPSSFVLPDII
jgi:hypothetical protein